LNAPPSDARPASVPTPSGRLAPGDLVAGRFRVARTLGEGASGVVYEAHDLVRDLDVALKVIHRHLLTDRQIRSRFDREGTILRHLDGDNLVRLLDHGEDDGLLYMALELAPGESLESLLVREGPLPIDRAVRIVLEVCAALEAAHAAGVVHRDLKPSNVMVEGDGGRDRIRVLDFGMAKVMRGESFGSTALTEQNMVFGTPEYMSPEQARGDELDARCDVYAAGVILYELLTGSVPFSGPTAVATMTAHLTEQVIAPTTRAPDRAIPTALEAVTLHALAKERHARYPTATSLREALARAMRDPADTESIRPPPSGADDDLATRDTELAPLASAAAPSIVREPRTSGSARWIAFALVAAAAGVAIGVWLSMRGAAP
jgi:serine/threonine protein kinase